MSVIFLTENNSLSKKVLKNPFSEKSISIFEVPFKKMRKRAVTFFRERLKESDAVIFSDSKLSSLLPEKASDTKALFDSVIINVLYSKMQSENSDYNRLVIYNPSEALIKAALCHFSDIALAGDGALLLSNRIYEMTGASLPVISGCCEKDIAICSKTCIPESAGFICGHDIESGINTLGGNSLKFYPTADYSKIIHLMKRPLTLKEAALLSEYDRKATFNIAF